MNSTNSISSRVGVELKQLRVKAGLTAFELAKMSGIKSEQQLYRYEKGSNKIAIGDLVAALRVLNVNIGSFFERLDLGEFRSTSGEDIDSKKNKFCLVAQVIDEPFSNAIGTDDKKIS
ncbi:helix-turn-helix transcriptional regulator [Providencia rettgeri]|nr:helix-turn-helix transcriptional regulator [Providencia rettgeri]